MIVWLVVLVAVIAGMWKMFEKAGKPGWAAIVPIYNLIVLLEVVGRPLWWIVLFLIPCVSFVAWIIIAIDVAKAFGKDVGFGIGLALLGFIFIPILGFGDARYVGPVAGSPPARV
ncbi:MAG: signal peptidase I [Acidobacteria bacterium]|nr:MAG: signal peptidase I [Acidobacteriota bacterium]